MINNTPNSGDLSLDLEQKPTVFYTFLSQSIFFLFGHESKTTLERETRLTSLYKKNILNRVILFILFLYVISTTPMQAEQAVNTVDNLLSSPNNRWLSELERVDIPPPEQVKPTQPQTIETTEIEPVQKKESVESENRSTSKPSPQSTATAKPPKADNQNNQRIKPKDKTPQAAELEQSQGSAIKQTTQAPSQKKLATVTVKSAELEALKKELAETKSALDKQKKRADVIAQNAKSTELETQQQINILNQKLLEQQDVLVKTEQALKLLKKSSEEKLAKLQIENDSLSKAKASLLSEQDTELAKLKTQLADNQKLIEKQQQAFKQLTESSSLKEDEKQKQIEALTIQIAKQEKDNQALSKEKISHLQAQDNLIQDLKDQLKSNQTLADQYKLQAQKLSEESKKTQAQRLTEITDLNKKLAEKESLLAKLQTNHDTKIKQLQSELDKVNEMYKTAQVNAEKAKVLADAQLIKTDKEIKNKNQTISELKTALSKLNNENSAKNSKQKSVSQQADKNKAEIDTLTHQLVQAKEAQSSLQAQLTQLQSETKQTELKHKNELDQLKQIAKEAALKQQQEVAGLTSKLAEAELTVKTIKQEQDELLKSNQAELVASKKEIEKLQDQFAQAQAAEQAQKAITEKLRTEQANETEKNQAEFELLKAELEKMKKLADDKQAEAEKLYTAQVNLNKENAYQVAALQLQLDEAIKSQIDAQKQADALQQEYQAQLEDLNSQLDNAKEQLSKQQAQTAQIQN